MSAIAFLNPHTKRLFLLFLGLLVATVGMAFDSPMNAALAAFMSGMFASAYLRRIAIARGIMRGNEP